MKLRKSLCTNGVFELVLPYIYVLMIQNLIFANLTVVASPISISLLVILARESPLTSFASTLVRSQTCFFPPSLMSRLSHCKPFFFRIFSHITELFRQIPQDLPPMKKSVTSYFHTNIYETTSGNFVTELLKFHINQIGLDRIMYSIDYPWVSLRSVLVFPSLSWLGTSSSSCR